MKLSKATDAAMSSLHLSGASQSFPVAAMPSAGSQPELRFSVYADLVGLRLTTVSLSADLGEH